MSRGESERARSWSCQGLVKQDYVSTQQGPLDLRVPIDGSNQADLHFFCCTGKCHTSRRNVCMKPRAPAPAPAAQPRGWPSGTPAPAGTCPRRRPAAAPPGAACREEEVHRARNMLEQYLPAPAGTCPSRCPAAAPPGAARREEKWQGWASIALGMPVVEQLKSLQHAEFFFFALLPLQALPWEVFQSDAFCSFPSRQNWICARIPELMHSMCRVMVQLVVWCD